MKQILVVDDEPNIVRLMQVNLERQGYRVETANNGAQALAKLPGLLWQKHRRTRQGSLGRLCNRDADV